MTDTVETKTVRKLFFEWDFEKGEAWFNEMAAEGWALKKPGMITYRFERCEPGEYTIRTAFCGENKKDYIRFLEESGAEYLGTDTEFLYFRKKTADGEPFELFSDIDSRIDHMKRIGDMLFSVGILNIVFGLINTILFSSTPVTRWTSLLNLLVAMPLMYGLGRFHGKIEALKAERQLHE